MKIMIVCSSNFYDKVGKIKDKLESIGNTVILPNGYGEEQDESYDSMTDLEYFKFFKDMYFESRDKINKVDAIIVLNYSKIKNGVEQKNYIGASTFLEMYEAFMNNKKIFILNDYPDNMLYDEIKGFNPVILKGNLDKVREV